MSIELYEEMRALKERVAALEAFLQPLEALLRQGHDNLVMSSHQPRKRPGPPKGYKRQPKQVPNASHG